MVFERYINTRGKGKRQEPTSETTKRRADARRTQQRDGGRQKGEMIVRGLRGQSERIARRWREDCEKVGRGL